METFRFSFQAMGCGCQLVVAAPSREVAVGGVEAAFNEIKRIETKYSRYLPESVVNTINAAAGRASVVYDDETARLFDYADTFYRQSDGLFDITSGILRNAWDFSKNTLPDESKLSSLLSLIGWNRVERSDRSIKLPDDGMQIDFGGIAKEYAADCVIPILYELGLHHGLINMAGDIRVFGSQPDGNPWTIGVQDPHNQGQAFASIPLCEGALATSGDYERYIEIDGERYCHILNPAKGMPVSFWRSVTVLAPLAVTAGSISTIAMLKEETGLDYLTSTGMKFIAVERSGKVHHRN
jgi:thiamine biosynthesis lipoprotein